MSSSFSADRCVPWLFSQAGVRLEGEPCSVAPAVDQIRGRIPRRSALGLKFAGFAGLFTAAIVMMAGARPARAEATTSAVPSIRSTAGIVIGAASVGAFAAGRRMDRSAPAIAVLCAGRDAVLDEHQLAALAGGARKGLAESSWPEGQVWLVSEAPLGAARLAQAGALEVRCFAPVNGRITEV